MHGGCLARMPRDTLAQMAWRFDAAYRALIGRHRKDRIRMRHGIRSRHVMMLRARILTNGTWRDDAALALALVALVSRTQHIAALCW